MTSKEKSTKIKKLDSGSIPSGRNERPKNGTLGERLKLVRGSITQESFSATLQVNKRTLINYEQGVRTPDAEFIRLLCVLYGVNSNWLILGEGEMFSEPRGIVGQELKNARGIRSQEEIAEKFGLTLEEYRRLEQGLDKPDKDFVAKWMTTFPDKAKPEIMAKLDFAMGINKLAEEMYVEINQFQGDKIKPNSIKDYIYIPIFDPKTSPELGDWNDRKLAEIFIAFDRQWLQYELNANIEKLFFVRITGESMETTFHTGDLIMIDQSINEAHEDGIYALMLNDQLAIKRLQRLPGRKIRVSSDNQAYKEFIMDDEFSDTDHYLVGKVIWVGKKI